MIFLSQGSRGEREIIKNILHFREEKEKWIFFSQGSRREREILKNILHFREEKEKSIFFSQGSRREQEIPRKILHFREEKEILFLRGEREISRIEIETHHHTCIPLTLFRLQLLKYQQKLKQCQTKFQ